MFFFFLTRLRKQGSLRRWAFDGGTATTRILRRQLFAVVSSWAAVPFGVLGRWATEQLSCEARTSSSARPGGLASRARPSCPLGAAR